MHPNVIISTEWFGIIYSSTGLISFFICSFQGLNIPCLDPEISRVLGLILQHYATEIEFVKKVAFFHVWVHTENKVKLLSNMDTQINQINTFSLQLYETESNDPPLCRNMSPVAGRIVWARHLYRKIEEPILYIQVSLYFSNWKVLSQIIVLKYLNIECICCHQQKNSDILRSPEGQEVVKMYNLTAAALMKFECVYHSVWIEEVSRLDYGWFSCSDLICWYSTWLTFPLLCCIIGFC